MDNEIVFQTQYVSGITKKMARQAVHIDKYPARYENEKKIRRVRWAAGWMKTFVDILGTVPHKFLRSIEYIEKN